MREELFQKAIDIVNSGERQLNYGRPEDNFNRIAKLWTAYLAIRPNQTKNIEPTDVCLMMLLMKLARLTNCPSHLDSMVDVIGYICCLSELNSSKDENINGSDQEKAN